MNDYLHRRLITQVRRSYARIPFYRERWPATAANITSLEEFRRLPFITKQDLLGDMDALRLERVAAPGSRVAGIHLTSGTSGLGQEAHPLTPFDSEALSSSWVRRLAWASIKPGGSIALTFPVGLQAGGLVGFRVAEKAGLIPYFLGPYNTDKKIEMLLKFQPDALVITPSYLSRLMTSLRDAGYKRAPYPIKALFISAESHTIQWARETSAWWGAPIFEWYSCMQAGTAVAYSCELGVLDGDRRGHLHVDEGRTLLEVLDPATDEHVDPGQEGEAVMTSLFREAFPIIRFRTRDRIQLHAEPCRCGRTGLSIVAGTASRYDDMMKIRGQNVWPAGVDEIVLGRREVEEYQARVFLGDQGDERVQITLEWAPQSAPSAGEEEQVLRAIEHEIRERLNVRMAVAAVPPQTLPRYEFKVRRWRDDRKGESGDVVHYTESTR